MGHHKRSPEAKKRRDELQEQKTITKWLINQTKHVDKAKREQASTLSTDDVYHYFVYNGVEPDPKCAPQNLEGVILHSDLRGDGILDYEPNFFTK